MAEDLTSGGDQPPVPNEALANAGAEDGETEPVHTIVQLPETLGLVETPELARAKDAYIEALRSEQNVARAADAYATLAEALDIDRSPEFQIALLISSALIRRQAGREEACQADLIYARIYAENMGLDEVAAALAAAIETSPAAPGPGEQHPDLQNLINASVELLGRETTAGLVDLGLDDEDLFVAIYAELDDKGVTEEQLRQYGLL